MFVAVAICELQIEESHSLKDKRMVVRSLKDKLRRSFPVSVAEVENNDLHQRGSVGVAMVSNSRATLESMMEKIGGFIEDHADARVLRWAYDVLPYEVADSEEEE